MKNALMILIVLVVLGPITALSTAQTYENQAYQTSTPPPLSQPLVREGDLALQLAGALGLGELSDEIEAESALSAVGIAPWNGWIADYPVTPDIVGELQAAVGEAADSGRLVMGRDEALEAFQGIIAGNELNLQMDTSGSDAGDTSGAEYPDSAVMSDYYAEEGPPVVTYYAPPPDYAYLYTWVPYPFWWWNYWLPGFFVLVDFDVQVHDHPRGRGDKHDHDRGPGKHISNHYRDPQTGRMFRLDPTSRFRGVSAPSSPTFSRPSVQRRAQPQVGTRSAPSGRPGTGTTRQEYRGYGSPGSSVGTRSSVFDRSVNTGVERSSSSRGTQSRSGAGEIRSSSPASSRGTVGGGGSSGSVGGSRGSMGGSGSGGGGYGGGGRR